MEINTSKLRVDQVLRFTSSAYIFIPDQIFTVVQHCISLFSLFIHGHFDGNHREVLHFKQTRQTTFFKIHANVSLVTKKTLAEGLALLHFTFVYLQGFLHAINMLWSKIIIKRN